MVRIITDSAADFEPWELEKMNITCIPLTVIFGDQEYQENVNLSKEQFYKLMESGVPPKTAQASPQILLDLLEEVKRSGDEAIYITLSGELSGTYQNARASKQMTEADCCYILNSKNATGGQRMLVEYAVKLRDQGKSLAQMVYELRQLRSRITLHACIDTLEYLYHGGRISQTAYKLGSLAQVKPIIRVSPEGKVEVPAKAMGMRKGMDYLCKRVEAQAPDLDFPFYVMYTKDRTNGEALAKRIRTMGIDVPDERIINVGAAIGSHIGPNACGLVYIAK